MALPDLRAAYFACDISHANRFYTSASVAFPDSGNSSRTHATTMPAPL